MRSVMGRHAAHAIPRGLETCARAQNVCMELKRPLVVLALVGSLAGCSSTSSGSNTDVDRGTTECGTAEDSADCEETEDAPGSEDDDN